MDSPTSASRSTMSDSPVGPCSVGTGTTGMSDAPTITVSPTFRIGGA